MGFREELLTDWNNKVIEYQNRKFLVMEQLEYEGKMYLYVVEKDSPKDYWNVAFLYRIKEDIFGNVSDDNLHNRLLEKVQIKTPTDEMLKSIRETKK